MKARMVAGVMVALLATLAWAVPASAHTGGPPAGQPCVAESGVQVCFEFSGDDIWVKDTAADGSSAVAKWTLQSWATDQCRNSHGANTWHECTYDWPENETVSISLVLFDGDTGKTFDGTPRVYQFRVSDGVQVG